MKVQISEDGVVVSSDGYLVTAPAIHPSGHIYHYVDGVDEIAELPVETYDLIVRLERRDARAGRAHAPHQ
jgi:hypothetical protein